MSSDLNGHVDADSKLLSLFILPIVFLPLAPFCWKQATQAFRLFLVCLEIGVQNWIMLNSEVLQTMCHDLMWILIETALF